jgi:glycosyltransferase involved in cell wall biosynthesis
MRLLFVTEFFPHNLDLKFTGGVEARTFYIAKNLAKTEKILVICRKTRLLNKEKVIGNISIHPCGLPTFNVRANFFSIFERIIFILDALFKGLRLKFDLVEGSNCIAYLPAFLAAKIKKRPAVGWYADILDKNWFKYFGPTGFFGFLMEKISLSLNWNRVIALSQATKKKLIKKGMEKNKIEVIYGGVDLDKFKSSSSSKVRQVQNKRNIICIARLVKYKRIEDLILAFFWLSKKYPLLSLTIVGQGSEEKRLKNLVKKKSLEDKVDFLSNLPRKKLIQLMKQSYIFCLPSMVEGFGLVTIEAAACATPFVIADTKVNQEITHHGRGGLLFKPQNVSDLAQKIEKLLENQKLYQQKQKQALKLVRNYSWDEIALKTEKVFKRALR